MNFQKGFFDWGKEPIRRMFFAVRRRNIAPKATSVTTAHTKRSGWSGLSSARQVTKPIWTTFTPAMHQTAAAR